MPPPMPPQHESKVTLESCAVAPADEKPSQKRRRILKTGHGKPPRLASRPHRRLVKAPHIATSFGWRLAAWRFFDGLALDQQWVWPAVTLYSRSSFGAMCLAGQSPESTQGFFGLAGGGR